MLMEASLLSIWTMSQLASKTLLQKIHKLSYRLDLTNKRATCKSHLISFSKFSSWTKMVILKSMESLVWKLLLLSLRIYLDKLITCWIPTLVCYSLSSVYNFSPRSLFKHTFLCYFRRSQLPSTTTLWEPLLFASKTTWRSVCFNPGSGLCLNSKRSSSWEELFSV